MTTSSYPFPISSPSIKPPYPISSCMTIRLQTVSQISLYDYYILSSFPIDSFPSLFPLLDNESPPQTEVVLLPAQKMIKPFEKGSTHCDEVTRVLSLTSPSETLRGWYLTLNGRGVSNVQLKGWGLYGHKTLSWKSCVNSNLIKYYHPRIKPSWPQEYSLSLPFSPFPSYLAPLSLPPPPLSLPTSLFPYLPPSLFPYLPLSLSLSSRGQRGVPSWFFSGTLLSLFHRQSFSPPLGCGPCLRRSWNYNQ